ncbi:MAG: alkyl hydroperoxide reductase [Bacteroidetes bacterium]|nr:MAG: alkyl hydroperoxide reductase [Bacteroidota bacterium]
MAVVCLLAGCGEETKPAAGKKEGSFFQKIPGELTDFEGKPLGVNFDPAKTTVFVFLSPDCPLCQSYTSLLSGMSDSIKACRMQLFGVFPGSFYTPEEIEAYRSEYAVRFPCVQDKRMWLCDTLGATVTPEAFVMDVSGKILYRGRIDDWMYDIGRKKPAPTRHDLRQALREVCSGRKVSVPETVPVGCFIEKS